MAIKFVNFLSSYPTVLSQLLSQSLNPSTPIPSLWVTSVTFLPFIPSLLQNPHPLTPFPFPSRPLDYAMLQGDLEALWSPLHSIATLQQIGRSIRSVQWGVCIWLAGWVQLLTEHTGRRHTTVLQLSIHKDTSLYSCQNISADPRSDSIDHWSWPLVLNWPRKQYSYYEMMNEYGSGLAFNSSTTLGWLSPLNRPVYRIVPELFLQPIMVRHQ